MYNINQYQYFSFFNQNNRPRANYVRNRHFCYFLTVNFIYRNVSSDSSMQIIVIQHQPNYRRISFYSREKNIYGWRGGWRLILVRLLSVQEAPPSFNTYGIRSGKTLSCWSNILDSNPVFSPTCSTCSVQLIRVLKVQKPHSNILQQTTRVNTWIRPQPELPFHHFITRTLTEYNNKVCLPLKNTYLRQESLCWFLSPDM